MCESGKHDLDSYPVPKLNRGKEICRGCSRERDAASIRQKRYQQNQEEALASIARGEVRMCGKGLHDMNKQDPPMWGPRGKVRCRECYAVVQAKAQANRAPRDYRKPLEEWLADLLESSEDVVPAYQPVRWQDSGECNEYDPELFFDDEKIEEAKAVCAGCLVREECLDYAIKMERTQPPFGVWGGLAVYERALMERDLTRRQLVLVS